jgi:putative transposase
MDFTRMPRSDGMVGKRKFRTLIVIDDSTREALVIDVDTSLSSKRIIRTLKKSYPKEVLPIL